MSIILFFEKVVNLKKVDIGFLIFVGYVLVWREGFLCSVFCYLRFLGGVGWVSVGVGDLIYCFFNW